MSGEFRMNKGRALDPASSARPPLRGTPPSGMSSALVDTGFGMWRHLLMLILIISWRHPLARPKSSDWDVEQRRNSKRSRGPFSLFFARSYKNDINFDIFMFTCVIPYLIPVLY